MQICDMEVRYFVKERINGRGDTSYVHTLEPNGFFSWDQANKWIKDQGKWG